MYRTSGVGTCSTVGARRKPVAPPLVRRGSRAEVARADHAPGVDAEPAGEQDQGDPAGDRERQRDAVAVGRGGLVDAVPVERRSERGPRALVAVGGPEARDRLRERAAGALVAVGGPEVRTRLRERGAGEDEGDGDGDEQHGEAGHYLPPGRGVAERSMARTRAPGCDDKSRVTSALCGARYPWEARTHKPCPRRSCLPMTSCSAQMIPRRSGCSTTATSKRCSATSRGARSTPRR